MQTECLVARRRRHRRSRSRAVSAPRRRRLLRSAEAAPAAGAPLQEVEAIDAGGRRVEAGEEASGCASRWGRCGSATCPATGCAGRSPAPAATRRGAAPPEAGDAGRRRRSRSRWRACSIPADRVGDAAIASGCRVDVTPAPPAAPPTRRSAVPHLDPLVLAAPRRRVRLPARPAAGAARRGGRLPQRRRLAGPGRRSGRARRSARRSSSTTIRGRAREPGRRSSTAPRSTSC